MPTMWFVKDGPRPSTTSEPSTTSGAGTPISFDEIEQAFAAYRSEFLGANPPQFNINTPSQYPRHVVIQVREEDGTSPKFPKAGFYLMDNLSPEIANRLLSEYRGGC